MFPDIPDIDKSQEETHIESYLDLGPTEYYGFLEAVNLNNASNIKRSITYLIEDSGVSIPSGVVVVMVGSDGKLEKHNQSKTELLVIGRSGLEELSRVLLNSFYDNELDELFEWADGREYFEYKELSNEGIPLSYVSGDSNAVYPDRILNSYPVFYPDSESLKSYSEARSRVVQEMLGSPRIKEKLKKQLSGYKSSMKSEQYSHREVFNSNLGVQYYDERRSSYTTGFKIPFLRTVQRKLDIMTAELFRGECNKVESIDVGSDLGTSVSSRLDYMCEHGMVQKGVADEVFAAYTWFLKQYHIAQEEYGKIHKLVEVPFNKEEFEHNKSIILKFANIKIKDISSPVV